MTDLTVKNIFFTEESVKINWYNSKKYFLTDESVKRQIIDSGSENLTDSDLESRENWCSSRVAHDFFSTGGSKNGFLCPARGNKIQFMTC